jgi:hypothetical protein
VQAPNGQNAQLRAHWAYTWLGYAGRSAAAGDAAALRYGLLGLGVLAMIAFLPRLFRQLRAREPAGSTEPTLISSTRPSSSPITRRRNGSIASCRITRCRRRGNT